MPRCRTSSTPLAKIFCVIGKYNIVGARNWAGRSRSAAIPEWQLSRRGRKQKARTLLGSKQRAKQLLDVWTVPCAAARGHIHLCHVHHLRMHTAFRNLLTISCKSTCCPPGTILPSIFHRRPRLGGERGCRACLGDNKRGGGGSVAPTVESHLNLHPHR